MSSLRVLIGIVTIASFLSACAIYRTANAPIGHGGQAGLGVEFAPRTNSSAGTPVRTKRVDLYGNEIEAAVGEYRIDLSGEMYEAHSPHTALPELGSPST